ncbi:MAG: hypothetical protein JWO78_2238 [Micavibrio sp.]|nr:hypothetical protein [Micavibrio sp.]
MLYEYNLRGIMTVLFRQQFRFLTVFFLVCLCGALYISQIQKIYESHGSLLVKFGQNAVPDLDRNTNASNDYSQQHDEIIQSNVKILQSEGLLSEVVKKIGVTKLYPELAASASSPEVLTQNAQERAARDLKVWTDSKSNVIELSVRNKDPVVATEFATTLMDMFSIRQAEVYSSPHTNFLKQQIDDAKAQLDKSQEEFKGYKQELEISDLDEEMSQLLQEKRELSGLAFQSVSEAQKNLAKLESDRSLAAATYKPDSPVMQRLDQNISVARAEVKARQGDLNRGSGTASGLPQQLKKIDTRIAYLELNRSKYNDLKQRVTLDEDKYKYYVQRGEDARVSDMLNLENITRISVVDQPVVPAKPAPGRRKILALAFLMTAFLLGLCTALAFEMLDDTIAYPEQITAATGLPVLASFSKMKKAA